MIETRPKTPAARGRIIKKGSHLGGSLEKGSAAQTVYTSPPCEGAGVVSEMARRAEAHHTSSAMTSLGLLVLLPLVSAASAAFMWSRPAPDPLSSGNTSDVALHARFTTLGNEIADRFTTKGVGTVIHPKKESPAVTKVLQPLRLQKKGPVLTSQKGTPQKVAAVENQVYRVLKKHGKPVQNGRALAAAIVKEAIAQNYDPVFVAAVIKSESAFNALARSHKGAQGLMQIMPKTGAWLADQQSIPRGKLTDPGHNLRLGISYLKKLENEYGGNRVLTLIAYNWGPGHVELAAAGSRRVPGEVMQYAVKILNDYRRWTSELNSSMG